MDSGFESLNSHENVWPPSPNTNICFQLLLGVCFFLINFKLSVHLNSGLLAAARNAQMFCFVSNSIGCFNVRQTFFFPVEVSWQRIKSLFTRKQTTVKANDGGENASARFSLRSGTSFIVSNDNVLFKNRPTLCHKTPRWIT